MKLSQLALNASTPKGNALATFPVLTLSCVTKLKQSGERPNARSSIRMKAQHFPHHFSLHLQRSLCQGRGPLSIPEKILPALLPNVIHQMNPSPGCSTISPSNKPSVPSSSISYFSLAIQTPYKAISSTCSLCTLIPMLSHLYH